MSYFVPPPAAASPPAPPPGPAADAFFYVAINNMVDPSVVPMSSAQFEFDQAGKWRLELPKPVLVTATKEKTVPLGLCIYLTPVNTCRHARKSRD